MSDGRVDGFLDVEQRALELVNELESLKKEIGHYRSAHESLGGVAADLREFTARLESLAEGTRGVIDAIKSIGTAEILSEVSATRERVFESVSEISAVGTGLREWASGVQGSVVDVTGAVASLSGACEAVGAEAQARLSAVQSELVGISRQVTATREETGAMQESIRGDITRASALSAEASSRVDAAIAKMAGELKEKANVFEVWLIAMTIMLAGLGGLVWILRAGR